MTLTWQPASGSDWVLDGSQGVEVVNEADGVFAIPTDLIVDQRVAGDGAVLVSARRAPRRVVFEFLLVDDVSVSTVWRQFLSSLARGGRFEYVGPNGIHILNEVQLEAPDRNVTGHDLAAQPADAVPVSFLALDPWWLDQGWQAPLNIGSATDFDESIAFDAPIPFNGGSTSLVQILGDDDVFPIVEVTGPVDAGMQITAGGGEGWETAVAVPAGETLIVRHTPNGTFYESTRGKIGPYLNSTGGRIDWKLLMPNSSLWGLQRGLSSVGVVAAGTDGNTLIRLLYHQRFLTP